MAPRKKGEPPNQSKAAKKRSYAKRTPQARANEKKTQAYSRPGKVTQAGVGNIPVTVARAAVTIGKHLRKNTGKARAAEKAAIDKQIQAEMRATRAKTQKEMSKIAKARSDREAAGRAADKAQAIRERNKRLGGTGRKGTPAEYKGTRTSRRMIDERGNYGWR